jgi:hypothetical protein
MSKTKKEEKAKARIENDACCCPFCVSRKMMEDAKDHYSGFFAHLRKGRIEVLRAFGKLIDERISVLEQKKRKVTKVKVE